VFKITKMVTRVTEILLPGEYKRIKAFSESCYSPASPGGIHRNKLDTRDTSRAQPSTNSTKSAEDFMLAKCANPACSATFRYLHEGMLFAIEYKGDSLKRGPPADPEYAEKSKSPQNFWLCSSCCRAMTVQSDGDHGISLVRKEKVPRSVSVGGDRTLMAA
jgi:hypothetical protein